MEFEAFDVKAKKMVKLKNYEVVKLKNGRLAVKGKSPETGITVYRILSNADAEKLKKTKK